MTASFDPCATAGAQPRLDSGSPVVPAKLPNRLQFSLSSLLILTALMAVGMVLLKAWGHWGLVAITAAGFAFTFYAIRWRNLKAVQGMVDMIWGVGLPLLCFAYDPGLLYTFLNQSALGNGVIVVALWQMVLLSAWIALGSRGPIWNGALSGGMVVGSLLACLIAIPLTLLAICFVWFVGFGLPGFVPLMTTWVYSRNWNQASFLIPHAGRERRRFEIAFATSLLLAVLWPTLLVVVVRALGWSLQFPQLAEPDFRL